MADPVGRYQIMRNDMPSSELQAAAYEMQNIDPATVWVSVCSAAEETTANRHLTNLRVGAPNWQTFKIVDTQAGPA
jgi:hypothetical protein